MIILSNFIFSDDAMAEFKCGYCVYSTELFESIIGYAVNIHKDKEISYLKRKKHSKTQLNPIQFPITPANEYLNGKIIIPNKDKCTVSIVSNLEDINCKPNKKLKKSNKNITEQPQTIDTTKSYTTNEKCCQTEDAFIINTEELVDKEKQFLFDIKVFFPLAIRYLYDNNQLAPWTLLFRCLANKRLPLNNISYHLCLDAVTWFTTENACAVRYNEVVRLWRTGKQLFKGKFLRFMSGLNNNFEGHESHKKYPLCEIYYAYACYWAILR